MYSGAIYYAYQSLVNTAKAMLLAENKKTNTHASIIAQFDTLFVETNKIELNTSFSELIYRINKYSPNKKFCSQYINDSKYLLQKVKRFRELSNTFVESVL